MLVLKQHIYLLFVLHYLNCHIFNRFCCLFVFSNFFIGIFVLMIINTLFYHHFINLLKLHKRMFEKLFMLVKNNAGTAVIDNPAIPVKYHEAVINDASSSIIEVLKGQLETGRVKDLIGFFQFSGIYNNALVSSIINKFANKLNNFYGVEPAAAITTASNLITPVMQELVKESKNEKNIDFGLSNLLSKLSGNQKDMSVLVNRMMIA